jgi:hypothetical protein
MIPQGVEELPVLPFSLYLSLRCGQKGTFWTRFFVRSNGKSKRSFGPHAQGKEKGKEEKKKQVKKKEMSDRKQTLSSFSWLSADAFLSSPEIHQQRRLFLLRSLSLSLSEFTFPGRPGRGVKDLSDLAVASRTFHESVTRAERPWARPRGRERDEERAAAKWLLLLLAPSHSCSCSSSCVPASHCRRHRRLPKTPRCSFLFFMIWEIFY